MLVVPESPPDFLAPHPGRRTSVPLHPRQSGYEEMVQLALILSGNFFVSLVPFTRRA